MAKQKVSKETRRMLYKRPAPNWSPEGRAAYLKRAPDADDGHPPGGGPVAPATSKASGKFGGDPLALVRKLFRR